jgi:ATP adenylyltransferase
MKNFYLCKNRAPRIDMKRLFSPWRMKYIQKTTVEEGCIFCNALGKEDGTANLIVARGERAFVILNLFPYTSGHIMVASCEHKASLDELDPATRAEMMELVSKCITTLKMVYHPQAFNMGANIGEAAGAGVPGHVHIHIVPRWNGDTNFMSTVGSVRVLPEDIEETYRRIRMAWGN